jgi:hypothetical protein
LSACFDDAPKRCSVCMVRPNFAISSVYIVWFLSP